MGLLMKRKSKGFLSEGSAARDLGGGQSSGARRSAATQLLAYTGVLLACVLVASCRHTRGLWVVVESQTGQPVRLTGQNSRVVATPQIFAVAGLGADGESVFWVNATRGPIDRYIPETLCATVAGDVVTWVRQDSPDGEPIGYTSAGGTFFPIEFVPQYGDVWVELVDTDNLRDGLRITTPDARRAFQPGGWPILRIDSDEPFRGSSD